MFLGICLANLTEFAQQGTVPLKMGILSPPVYKSPTAENSVLYQMNRFQ